MDGRSVLSLLSLAASRGTRLRIRAVGPDAQAAVEALGRLLEEQQPRAGPTGGGRRVVSRPDGASPQAIESARAVLYVPIPQGIPEEPRHGRPLVVHVRIGLEGHPDKMCDQISDAILDAMLDQDPRSRVACETLTTTGPRGGGGRDHDRRAQVEITPLVRGVVEDIGYTNSDDGLRRWRPAPCMVALGKQSPDIAQGVTEGEGLHKEQGAGDQGMMFGYACDETPELMPAPIRLAHRLIERHREHFESGELEFLRPDAKSQVTIEYDGDRPRAHPGGRALDPALARTSPTTSCART